MGRLSLLLMVIFFSIAAHAQKTIPLRTMWGKPHVHVLFGDYIISFKITDIDKALALLDQAGVHTYGASCGLDTGRDYQVELYAGLRGQYQNSLEPVLQRAVGAFLLSTGHGYVQNKKHRYLKSLVLDTEPVLDDEQQTVMKFYDPKNGKLLFYGILPVVMYTKDIGLD